MPDLVEAPTDAHRQTARTLNVAANPLSITPCRSRHLPFDPFTAERSVDGTASYTWISCPVPMAALLFRMHRHSRHQRHMSCLIFDPQTSRNLGELGRNLEEISDSQTAETQHWRGFPGSSVVSLLIRRSLVRAQVGEPRK